MGLRESGLRCFNKGNMGVLFSELYVICINYLPRDLESRPLGRPSGQVLRLVKSR